MIHLKIDSAKKEAQRLANISKVEYIVHKVDNGFNVEPKDFYNGSYEAIISPEKKKEVKKEYKKSKAISEPKEISGDTVL